MANIQIRKDQLGDLSVVSNYSAGAGLSFGRSVAGTLQSTAALLGADIKSSYLEGIFDDKNPKDIHAIYRDIYLHDPISGAAVDLRSTLPWSDFTLVGADDNVVSVLMENIERLNLKTLQIEMCIDQLVSGAFIGTLLYDKKLKGFSDIIPWDYADCELDEIPLYGIQPNINVLLPDKIKEFIRSEDKDLKAIRNKMPSQIVKSMRDHSKIRLDPLSAIYLPRRTLSTIQSGISLYRRILPIYLLERLLYRGTVTEASKRQRSTLHITMGDEEWIPTEEDMNSVIGLFQSTEQDPLSSIVATRNSIQTNEVRSAGDFWKWTDIIDQLNTMKMQSLGINEGFLSGDSSYANMEAALSVFIEDLRAYRERVTKSLYYNKIFPLLSQLNKFYKEDKKSNKNFDQNDPSQLIIPEITWHKTLRPEADADFIGILESLSEKGVPIPIRMWASAGGVNLDHLIDDLEDDKNIKEKIALAQGKDPNAKDEEDDDDLSFSRYLGNKKKRRRRNNFLNRDYGEAYEVLGRTKTGKRKHIMNQRKVHKRINELGAKALSNLAKNL